MKANLRSGIYHIQIGPWFYYGQSINVHRRLKDHICKLQKNKHGNPILQNAYNKYQQFESIVIGLIPVEELDGAEQFFIDSFYGEEYCANIAKDVIATNRDRKASNETKAKISAAGIGRIFSEEHKAKMSAALLGRVHSEETKNKIATTLSDKLKGMSKVPGSGKPSRSVEINGTWYPSIKEASEKTGIPYSTIRTSMHKEKAL